MDGLRGRTGGRWRDERVCLAVQLRRQSCAQGGALLYKFT